MAALQCEICGGKLVGKPGGLFECEYCGMEYNTDWAKAKIQEIAELKMPDLNAASLEAAMSMIAGTARSMGITVED